MIVLKALYIMLDHLIFVQVKYVVFVKQGSKFRGVVISLMLRKLESELKSE